jgi:3-oxoacyl-[acyl-carrier protein] reductase
MAAEFERGGAFVLGGSGGLGSAICLAFARAGVSVGLSYRSAAEVAAQLSDQILALGVTAHVYQLDGSDRDSLVRALDDAAAKLGGLHSVVYAAGPNFTPQFFSRIDPDVWQDWLQHDVMAAVNLAQAAIPHLRHSRGAFTALSTYQGQLIEVRGGVSAISKAAIDRMVAVMAKEEGRYGVRANTLRCGWIRTKTVDKLFEADPRLAKDKARMIPLGRVGLPEEIGESVVFLSSRHAGFITGANLIADGGESL